MWSGSFDYAHKTLVVGPPSVGKSSLIRLCTYNEFSHEYTPGTEPSFESRFYKAPGKTTNFCLFFWDIPGQTTTWPYGQGEATILCYDITRRASFECLSTWLSRITPGLDSTILYLVGCKIDLESRVISSQEGQEFADSINASFWEVSSKLNKNVTDLFVDVSSRVYSRRNPGG